MSKESCEPDQKRPDKEQGDQRNGRNDTCPAPHRTKTDEVVRQPHTQVIKKCKELLK